MNKLSMMKQKQNKKEKENKLYLTKELDQNVNI